MRESRQTREELVSELAAMRRRLADLEQTATSQRQARELYETLANSSPVGMYIFQDHKFRFINSEFRKQTGFSEKELLARAPYDLVHPDDRANARQNAIQMLKGERQAPYEFRSITRSGQTIWSMESVSSIIYNGKRATLGTFMDITERKKAEEALRESEERYSALVNLGGRIGEAIIMLLDKGGAYSIQIFVSDEWPRITGYSKEELLGMSFLDLLHPRYREASLKRHKRKISGETMPGLFEMAIIRKDGTEVPIEVTSAYTTYRGERANVAFIRDITDRKEAEAKLLDYQHELRSMAAQLSLAEERERHLIATELHDHVSQSLAICNMKLGALLELSSSTHYLTKNLEELRALVTQMIKETRSLSFSISSPLLYVFGLDAAIEQLAEDMEEQYDIAFEYEVSKQLQPLEDDVRVLLYRTVYELFTNVIKHAQARRVQVAMKQHGESLRITIEDDGIGFDTTQLNDSMRKTKGFGLFSIRERLSYIGGEVDIESQPGLGTKVTITAPLKQEAKKEIGAQSR